MNFRSSSARTSQFESMQVDVASFAKVTDKRDLAVPSSEESSKKVNAVAAAEYPYSLKDMSLVLYSRIEPSEEEGSHQAQIRISESEGALVASGSEPVRVGPSAKSLSRMEVNLDGYDLPTPGTYTAELIIGDRVFQSQQLQAVYLD